MSRFYRDTGLGIAALIASLFMNAGDASGQTTVKTTRARTAQVARTTTPARTTETVVEEEVAEPKRVSTSRRADNRTFSNPYGFRKERQVSHTYIPNGRPVGRGVSFQEEVIEEGPVLPSTGRSVPQIFEESGCESCGSSGHSDCGCDDHGCSSCGDSECGGCVNGCLIACPTFTLRNAEFNFGVNGFKGPPNRGEDGSFGFYEGVNLGVRLPCMPSDLIAGQFGATAVQSNFGGAPFTDENREQLFLTGGIFRRVDYGFQAGIVYDYLQDGWYSKRKMGQVRGLFSWVYEGGNEFGVQYQIAVENDTSFSLVNGIPVLEDWKPIDVYSLFYRHTFDECSGANARILGGFTADSAAFVGSDFWVPICENWAINGGFSYLMPEDNQIVAGNVNESWNVGWGLTWYPGGLSSYRGKYHRPMFDVANNGSFFVQRP